MMNEINLSRAIGNLEQLDRIFKNIEKSMLSGQIAAQAREEQALMRVIDMMVENITNSKRKAA
ncbi:hypothetical protein H3S90_07865 [Bartonella sp. W8097]|uniref:hypothetical protein n=1 Tax=Bartonella apihabitans TaxID=2750929 RepID=UPI0018DC78C3|nr:hypothetical protein [Bartonella apihabitans]MBI0020999.1 hypothetical protein [Bartonella apihabitans]